MRAFGPVEAYMLSSNTLRSLGLRGWLKKVLISTSGKGILFSISSQQKDTKKKVIFIYLLTLYFHIFL